ncbi:MAG: bifunctional folylpolyglutamate synthase/dihydrofolate synthase, partial [Deltaproteobacteria bacterium]|nr:bifunctional folylpolyglutamate synthase/dihydrofolate synthase [Deltaproteobacteria bacterium]
MKSHPILDQLATAGVRLGIERIGGFLLEVGEPHRAAPVVHVAGTNGKGSVCAFVTASLVAAGYRVGTTISPHLEEVNERVLIDGLPVDDATLAEAIETIDRARWDWARKNGITGIPLTYFEFTIAVAFRVFAHRRVDVVVVEVGMGGRLDATNVVSPAVCAITHIGLDHQSELGSTLAAIAGEKAGILKKQVPAVIGALPAEAREVVEGVARRLGVPLWRPGAHLRKEQKRDGRWTFATPAGGLADVRLGLDGQHQGGNALVALGILVQLRQQGLLVPDEAIRKGLESAYIGGRLEVLAPGLLVDGAHNEDGAKALAAWLQANPKKGTRILLFGMGNGRDPASVLKPLVPHVDEVVTTWADHPN